MRVLIVNSFYDPDLAGGAEISIKILAENLALKGIDVAVYTTDVVGIRNFSKKIINRVIAYS